MKTDYYIILAVVALIGIVVGYVVRFFYKEDQKLSQRIEEVKVLQEKARKLREEAVAARTQADADLLRAAERLKDAVRLREECADLLRNTQKSMGTDEPRKAFAAPYNGGSERTSHEENVARFHRREIRTANWAKDQGDSGMSLTSMIAAGLIVDSIGRGVDTARTNPYDISDSSAPAKTPAEPTTESPVDYAPGVSSEVTRPSFSAPTYDSSPSYTESDSYSSSDSYDSDAGPDWD